MRPMLRASGRRNCVSYKPYHDEPVVEFIPDHSHPTSLEPQSDCYAGDCEADGVRGDDVGRHVVRDVQLLILYFGGRWDGSHVDWKTGYGCALGVRR